MLQLDFSVKVDAMNFYSGGNMVMSSTQSQYLDLPGIAASQHQRNSAKITAAEKDCIGKLLPIILFLSFIIGFFRTMNA